MRFCIFSYNRGPFLEHCVSSIERCAPGSPVCIIDDGSGDPATLAALASLGTRHEVVTAERAPGGKHGGLYANMQAALERFPQEPLLCFLQDDMQLVRRLEAAEIAGLEAYFGRFPAAGFLHPCFLKGSRRSEESQALRFDAGSGTYRREPGGRSVGRFYSDIFLAPPARLLEQGWRFESSEPANERQAAARFTPMGHLFAPFAMWLPEVPAWRGKRKTLALRLAERRRGCGFHPLEFMTAEEAEALKQRDAEVLPFAEDFLRCAHALPRPWRYYPLQDSRLLKKLNSAENFLRGLTKRRDV